MRLVFVSVLLFLLSIFSLQGKEVSGIIFEDSLSFGNKQLQLNGVGILKKSIFRVKVYANALYLLKKSSNPHSVITADETMAVRMHILYKKITNRQLLKGLRDGFGYSTGRDKAALATLQPRIDKFLSFFVGKPDKYDTATFLYIPGSGTHVSINKTYKGYLPGLDFKKALFGMWLGINPADEQMKRGMLTSD
ncbi:chalcone isomerase family protein [bacterium]|nr:chalcone isomerase family protein [bacterium]